jgi:hypothetical protein
MHAQVNSMLQGSGVSSEMFRASEAQVQCSVLTQLQLQLHLPPLQLKLDTTMAAANVQITKIWRSPGPSSPLTFT